MLQNVEPLPPPAQYTNIIAPPRGGRTRRARTHDGAVGQVLGPVDLPRLVTGQGVGAAGVGPDVGKRDFGGGALLEEEAALLVEEEDGEGPVQEPARLVWGYGVWWGGFGL